MSLSSLTQQETEEGILYALRRKRNHKFRHTSTLKAAVQAYTAKWLDDKILRAALNSLRRQGLIVVNGGVSLPES